MYRLFLILILITSCSREQIINTDFNKTEYQLPLRSSNYVSLSRIQTGHNLSAEPLVMEYGRNKINHYSSHQAFVIEKNKHRLLVDTGMSKNGKEQLKEIPLPFRGLLDYQAEDDIASNHALTFEAIFITHMHFDHVSAIKEVATKNKTKVFVSKKELDSAMSKSPPFGYIPSQYNSPDITWNTIPFTEKKYGPFKRYYDYFNDGSVIIVELPGHTKGSIGILVNTNNSRVFLVGDAVWTIDEVISNKAKSKMASFLVDENKEETLKTISLLHNIWMANPDTRIVPAHDLKASVFINTIKGKQERM